ncbi:MAG: DUF1343 domain-containing protein [Chlorobi bacterium]|nr:DUF1343 domain-containing protein [Chlorobiota bacterium]
MIKKLLSIIALISIFTLEASALGMNNSKIKLGIDVLIESNFEQVKGLKIALLTNHAGRTSNGDLTVEAFLKTNSCTITTLLTPEHGFYTTVPAGNHVKNDVLFNLPAISLYGSNRRPQYKHLDNCDAVVIDIQDIGIRSYTYISTMYKTMDACADFGKKVIILDRPNPLGGMIVDGNTVEPGKETFVGIIPVSYIHGCTVGELAKMINNEGWLPKDFEGKSRQCDLTVIKMEKWERWMAWEDTGLLWFPTSPHIPTVNSVRGAAMLGIIGELSVTSIGIGTTLPFQYIGSPYIKPDLVEKELKQLSYHGVNLVPARYRPFYGMYRGKDCNGWLLSFPLDNLFAPYTTGLEIMLAYRKAYPKYFTSKNIKKNSRIMFQKVTGTAYLFKALMDGGSDEEVMRLARKGMDSYILIREKYLLY